MRFLSGRHEADARLHLIRSHFPLIGKPSKPPHIVSGIIEKQYQAAARRYHIAVYPAFESSKESKAQLENDRPGK